MSKRFRIDLGVVKEMIKKVEVKIVDWLKSDKQVTDTNYENMNNKVYNGEE